MDGAVRLTAPLEGRLPAALPAPQSHRDSVACQHEAFGVEVDRMQSLAALGCQEISAELCLRGNRLQRGKVGNLELGLDFGSDVLGGTHLRDAAGRARAWVRGRRGCLLRLLRRKYSPMCRRSSA